MNADGLRVKRGLTKGGHTSMDSAGYDHTGTVAETVGIERETGRGVGAAMMTRIVKPSAMMKNAF